MSKFCGGERCVAAGDTTSGIVAANLTNQLISPAVTVDEVQPGVVFNDLQGQVGRVAVFIDTFGNCSRPIIVPGFDISHDDSQIERNPKELFELHHDAAVDTATAAITLCASNGCGPCVFKDCLLETRLPGLADKLVADTQAVVAAVFDQAV